MKKFKKEFVTFTDPEIDELFFGGIPSHGRFFTKKCKKISQGVFTVEVEVPKGELSYHFYHGDHYNNISLDPNNLQRGAKNWHSICEIGTAATLPANFEDTPSFVSQVNSQNYEFKVIASERWIQEIHLQIYDDTSLKNELELPKLFSYKKFTYYKILIPKEFLIAGDKYLFKIIGSTNTYYLGTAKTLLKSPAFFFEIDKILNPKTELNYPANSIVYQCFPDTFCKIGNISTSIELETWGSEPSHFSFFGGNLKGIISKLDYLSNLNITHLYLTPIFEAKSNHRYDCINYKNIDPLLGNKEDFEELVEKAHSKNIKITLDIVLNHCGVNYFAFQDVLQKQEKSKYKDWFVIEKFPVEVKSYNPNYKCWWNNGNMPEFNFNNPEVRDHLLDICKFWITEYNVDGWRIDVSSEIEIKFLKKLRTELKTLKSDTLLIGENWKDASLFLNDGDTLCGVTNYIYWWKLLTPLLVEKKLNISTFATFLMDVYFKYPHNRVLNNWNIISSHDIPRFISMLENKKDIYYAVFLQFMLPGTPILYYGDEIGLEGLDDPLNRACMNWDLDFNNNKLFKWYKLLINIYLKEKSINQGHLSIIKADDTRKIFIFKRYLKDSSIIYCAMNMSNERKSISLKELNITEQLVDLITMNKIDETITFAPGQCLILK
ncbi:MAG: glycoside hydrolase family 13 protein [Halanaerobiales bacterium]|nr:glycoside hydrolase family 13 protein [Halanaerobiales bacterium]